MKIEHSKTLGDCFTSFEKSAFRLQVLPVYGLGEGEAEYQQYVNGRPLPDRTNNQWIKRIREYTSSGRVMTNVLALRNPMNSHVRYGIDWWYPYRFEAGERSLFIKPQSTNRVPATWRDFWLFDSRVVVLMNYSTTGQFENSEVLQNSDELAHYVRVAEDATSMASPLHEILSALRQSPCSL